MPPLRSTADLAADIAAAILSGSVDFESIILFYFYFFFSFYGDDDEDDEDEDVGIYKRLSFAVQWSACS